MHHPARGDWLLAAAAVLTLSPSGTAAQAHACASARAPARVAIRRRITQMVSGRDAAAAADRRPIGCFLVRHRRSP